MTVGNKFKKLRHKSYVVQSKTFTKLHSGCLEILENKDFLSSNENYQEQLRGNDEFRRTNHGQNLSWQRDTLCKWRKKIDQFRKVRKMLVANAVALLETARHRRLLGAEKELNKKENIDCWTV